MKTFQEFLDEGKDEGKDVNLDEAIISDGNQIVKEFNDLMSIIGNKKEMYAKLLSELDIKKRSKIVKHISALNNELFKL